MSKNGLVRARRIAPASASKQRTQGTHSTFENETCRICGSYDEKDNDYTSINDYRKAAFDRQSALFVSPTYAYIGRVDGESSKIKEPPVAADGSTLDQELGVPDEATQL